VNDTVLTASNLTEADYSAWGSGTTYAKFDRVRVVSTTLAKRSAETWLQDQDIYWDAARSRATTTVIAGAKIGRSAGFNAGSSTGTVNVHAEYESQVNSNSGNNPVSDAFEATPKWVKIGATNKWRAFDDTISYPASSAGDITFEFTLPSLCTGVAFFGLLATQVTVTVRDAGNAIVYTQTRDAVNTDEITDWFEYFAWQGSPATEMIFTGLPGYAGHKIQVTISGTDTQVGEIVVGRVVQLGTSMAGTEPGFESFSRKDRDEFGNVILVSRAYADYVTFRFAVALSDARRVKRIIAGLESTPAVWFAGPDVLDRGATVYGFPTRGLRLPLEAAGVHFASLEIEGLT
jgi:hypothetical protein